MDYNTSNLIIQNFHNRIYYNNHFFSLQIIILLLLIDIDLHADAISFKRTDFRNWPDIMFDGDASANPDGVGLTLNLDKIKSAGRAVFAKETGSPANLKTGNGPVEDFDTSFSFTITTLSNDSYLRGDGFAFFLANTGSRVPPSSWGGCLGLISNCEDTATSGLVAVEFDSFQNDFDRTSCHIGINVNSIISVKTVTLTREWTPVSRGFARIWYTSRAKTLSVMVDYHNQTYKLSHHPLDLSKVLPKRSFGFSASTGHSISIHRILSWEFNSTGFSLIAEDGAGLDRNQVVACILGGLTFLVFIGVALFYAFRRRDGNAFICNVFQKRNGETECTTALDDVSNMDREFEHDIGPKKFSYKELVKATNKFAEQGILGGGGFGEVYKGYLRHLNLTVAVKRVSKRSKQGRKEYMSEVKIISRLRHKNLVQLIGWCHDNKEFLLIYEFLSNGSLDSHLFGRERSILSWKVRHKIVLGLASALLYLHEESEQCVLHRDIKSSNIMLDSDFNAKLGDFGLARLVDEATGSRTTALAGTLGYMAPEYINTSKASKASDVFSFGVVALEIACGRKSIEHDSEEEDRVSLVSWVWDFYGSGRLLDVVDERLCLEFDVRQMECLLTVGLWCVHPDHNLRPSIKDVIQVLSFEAPLPDLPRNMPVPNYHVPDSEILHSSTSAATITDSSFFTGR